jgi:hypothetical protein
MPILKGLIESDGMLLDLRVALGATQAQKKRSAGQPLPAPIQIRALVDPGADCTCIDPSALAPLTPNATGVTLANVPSVGGLASVIQYDVSLTLIHPSGDARKDLVLRDHPVIELALGPLGIRALIGRDVLSHCHLFYDGTDNTFSLAY